MPPRSDSKRWPSAASTLLPLRAILRRRSSTTVIARNVEEVAKRRKFILKLAKALLSFGAPSHRIESQLKAASDILDAQAEFVHLPNIIIVSIRNGDTRSTRTHFVRATGRIALTSLHKVHMIYRDVLHDNMGTEEGTEALKTLLRSRPIYRLLTRCALAFVCGAIICVLSFGGSAVDMWISGACAFCLQYLGLNTVHKSAMYANVYEISVTIIVAFVARGLSSIPGNLFCYSAISSAGVVVILPGFTVLTSALELMSRNIFCGSVRIVYAIIYTLFLGFGLTIGSDLYLVVDRRARRAYYRGNTPQDLTYTHGRFTMVNGSSPWISVSGVLAQGSSTEFDHIYKGCHREPYWPWYKRPLPWWTAFFLVPIYSTCSSLSNLQAWNQWQLVVMVVFSCCAYAANRATSTVLPGRTDIVSASGAFVIGSLGNVYSRVVRGTAFTSMVTGVLFLVPSGIAQGGGLTQTYHSSAEQYSGGFSLALRMISVASGVTIGLFVSQVIVYLFGTRKNAAHFAF
ncbi:putative threonine/serine exporter [Lyophyllum shimeji]|uniref:Threonine/serine exporter n=1 Tax=Lyophyllum shimeji TaxID=47721 RepID=A0A9P3PIH7_LYOSH|nr:putative threonine/serine exporter [Lyophyllum shimeji]